MFSWTREILPLSYPRQRNPPYLYPVAPANFQISSLSVLTSMKDHIHNKIIYSTKGCTNVTTTSFPRVVTPAFVRLNKNILNLCFLK